MAKIVWSLICRRAIVDEHLKLASLIDVVEAFDITTQPGKLVETIPIEFSVVTLWTRDDPSKPEVTQERIRVIAPNGKESASSTVASVDLSAYRNFRNVIVYQGLQFLGTGDYVFIVELKTGDEWAERTRLILTVNQVTSPVPAQ